ncbi:hypothetical protein [Longispora fulva]|uniref:Uncharacterized protein n=1 Tax=Longispora fulva TaxID=619741 RepID=A0A8J7GS89_9ACTN|nr:hypothetical protein [Longispora fulva]MBG6136081.1 hypothetical protein [Longispora fulva]
MLDDVHGEADLGGLVLPDAPILIASRRPLPAYRSWNPAGPVATVEVGPWPDDRISALLGGAPASGPEYHDNVLRLAGGNPLLAIALSRTPLTLPGLEAPGAMADGAARQVLDRLAGEAAGIDQALLLVAAVGQCDEDLLVQLGQGPAFAGLLGSSVIIPLAHGLAVVEPFRTVFDLALRWRAPVSYQTALTLAAAHHTRLLSTDPDRAARSDRVVQSLFLTVGGGVRSMFAPVTAPVHIRPARAEDERDLGRLIRLRSTRGDIDPRQSERQNIAWLHELPEGVHVVCDEEDRPVGMTGIVPITDHTVSTLEPVLQQHAETAAAGGVFLGTALYDERYPAARTALFRFIIATSFQYGRLVISTPTSEYQQVSTRLGFHAHGPLRHDVFGGPLPTQVYSQSFTTEALSGWLDRLRGPRLAPVLPDDTQWAIGHLREALEHLDRPLRLARSPLLAVVGDPATLRDLLRGGIRDLANSTIPAEAEAGQILTLYYLDRTGGHEFIAHRLHLSRATYYRRLNQGLEQLTRPLLAMT